MVSIEYSLMVREVVHFYACQASQDETAASRGGSNITLELYLPLIKPGISVLVHIYYIA